jgi:putative transposase
MDRPIITAHDRHNGCDRTVVADLALVAIRQLVARARAEGLKLTGEGGLLGRLTQVVIESALEAEMDDHLGYGKHDPAGRNEGNSRNGTRSKTVVTPGRAGGD